MPRFNTFLTVVLTFFAFLMAFGGGLLTAIRLTMPERVEPAPAAIIQQEARPFPGQPSRLGVSLAAPFDALVIEPVDDESMDISPRSRASWIY